MLPALVKNRETSSPRSAMRAIFSADAAFPDLRVFFIKMLLLLCRLPQSNKVVVLTLVIFSHLKNESVEQARNPPNRALLLRSVKTIVEIKRVRKYLLRLFEPNTASGVRPQPFALRRVEAEPHCGITVIPRFNVNLVLQTG